MRLRRLCAPARCEKEWITALSSITHARAEHDIGLDRDVFAEFGVGLQEHRLRRDHGDAGIERGFAQFVLHGGLHCCEPRFGVDARDFFLADFDRDRVEPVRARDRDRIGQIEFLLGIVVADPLQN